MQPPLAGGSLTGSPGSPSPHAVSPPSRSSLSLRSSATAAKSALKALRRRLSHAVEKTPADSL